MKVKPASVGMFKHSTRSRDRRVVTTNPTASEHHCWDPKGGELCLTRAKPEETLVEARSRSDVQIDGQSWV